MIKFVRIVGALGVLFILLICAKYTHALETEFHGRLQSTYVLRDYTGFQYGFMDEVKGIQWRNELKFDITARPEYEGYRNLRLEKIFLSYRGAYDAIYDLTDRFDAEGTGTFPDNPGLRDKGPADWELGKDDVETENDLREAFIDLVAESEYQKLILRLGRQIVQWGEADGFFVVNQIHPFDNSTLLFFDMPEELATPLWMARVNYSRPDLGPLQEVGLEILLIPDVRPWQLAPLDDTVGFTSLAPYAFGLQQLRIRPLEAFSTTKVQEMLADVDLGQVVSRYPDIDLNGLLEVVYGPERFLRLADLEEFRLVRSGEGGSPGRLQWKQDVPASGRLENTEVGVRFQAGYGSFMGNLYYLHGFQNFLAADWSELLVPGKVTFTYPEQDMYGVSFNIFLSSVNGILRGEGCLIDRMHFLNIEDVAQGVLATLDGSPPTVNGITTHETYYFLLGFDKDLWIRWLNPAKMIGTSWQVYQRHIAGWTDHPEYGLFYKDDNYRITGYFYTDYWHGRIHPDVMLMYDPEGAWMTMASVKYTKDGRLFYKLTQISFWGRRGATHGNIKGATSDFTEPFDLIPISEISLRVGYNW